MKKLIIISACLLLASCQKDYSTKPSPFNDGDHVRLHGVNPSKSFIPHCGDPSMVFIIDDHYLIKDQIYWWYDMHCDTCILKHVANDQIKKAK